MNSVDTLEHDHDVLGSQVRHVTALLNGLLSRSFAAGSLRIEFVRETTILGAQVAAHFEFEEAGAFPELSRIFPEDAPALENLVAAHALISGALQELMRLASNSTQESFEADLGRIVEAYERFHVAFLMHVQEESELLHRISDKLSPAERATIAKQIAKHQNT